MKPTKTEKECNAFDCGKYSNKRNKKTNRKTLQWCSEASRGPNGFKRLVNPLVGRSNQRAI